MQKGAKVATVIELDGLTREQQKRVVEYLGKRWDAADRQAHLARISRHYADARVYDAIKNELVLAREIVLYGIPVLDDSGIQRQDYFWWDGKKVS